MSASTAKAGWSTPMMARRPSFFARIALSARLFPSIDTMMMSEPGLRPLGSSSIACIAPMAMSSLWA